MRFRARLALPSEIASNLRQDGRRWIHAFERAPKHTLLQNTFRLALEVTIRANSFRERVAARLKRTKVALQR